MTQKRVKASDVIGNSYYIYTLQSSNNTPSLNSTINITCNVTNVYGQAVSGKSITLYQNNTSQGAKTTDSNGNASWNSISMSNAGLQTFKVENSKIEIFVDNKSDVGHTHSQYLTEHQDLSNYVTTDDSRLSDARTPKSHTHTKSQITDFPSLATVATSGSYNDLTNKPTIPEGVAVDTELSTSSNNAIANSTVTTALNGKSDSGHTHSNYLTSSDISGKIDTAGTGLSKSGTTLNHSNSVTALTTASLKKVKYDAQGHITGTSDVSGSDLPSHTHSQYLTSHQDISNKENIIELITGTQDTTVTNRLLGTITKLNSLQEGDKLLLKTPATASSYGTGVYLRVTLANGSTNDSLICDENGNDITRSNIPENTILLLMYKEQSGSTPRKWLIVNKNFNGDYNSLINKPTIPSKTSDLTNDSGFLTSHQDISGKIDTAGTGLSKSGTTLNHSNSVTALTTASFKKVKYDAQGHITGTSDVGASDLPSHNHTKSQITDFPTSMTPTSHTHGNLQNNGQVGSTAQANKNVVTDSSGKITTEDKPTIPSKTSDLTNDSGFLTSHQNISGKENISNKVTSISSSSTDTQYPSAKCVYDENDNLWNYVENLDYTQIGGNLVVSDEGIQAQGLEQIINQIISRLMAKSDIDHTHSGYASSSHTHSTWSSTSISNGTLYYNSAIRLCSLRYSRTFNSASANTMYEWGQLIPSGYRPKYMVSGSGNRNGATIIIDSDGYVYGRFAIAFSSSTDFYYHIMWHY